MKTTLSLLLVAFSLGGAELLTDTNIDTSTILVRHRPGVRASDIDSFHRNQGSSAIINFKHFAWSAVKMPTARSGRDAIENYRNSRLFDKAQFQRIYRTTAIPDDPLYPQLWNMAKISAPQGWDVSMSNDVVIAVIDTGVDFNHPDLQDNLWTGPNGEHGYTAVGGVLNPGGQDDHFHGTHVAGILGAVGNNGLGVVGVNWRVKILSLKFLSSFGAGYSSDAVLCIDQMIELKKRGVNIRVSNNSWGASGYDPVIEDAFLVASAEGILNVCAAGNNAENSDAIAFSPASLSIGNIISVLASDPSDAKATFSNYGSTTTDILAPGVAILSAKLGGDYWPQQGTSMASPHVAGVCAAMFGRNPSLTAKQCKAVLLDPGSYDQTAFTLNTTSGGRVNLYKCLTNPMLFEPPSDHDPVLKISPTNFMALAAGQIGTMSAFAFDPDGDPLVSNTMTFGQHADGWLIQRQTSPALISAPTSSLTVTVTNPPSGRDYNVRVRFTVTDGRGGSALAIGNIFAQRQDSLVHPLPDSTLSIRSGEFGPLLLLSMSGEPNGAQYAYTISGNSIFRPSCCFPVNVEIPITSDISAGPLSFRAHVMDTNGNFSNSEPLVHDPQNTGRYSPNIKVQFSTLRGPSPLSVIADMSETDPGNYHNLWYSANYWRQGGFAFELHNPVRRLILTEPGVHAIQLTATDPVNRTADSYVALFTVLPTVAIETNLPPIVRLVAPQDLSVALSGSKLILTWSDSSTGEDRWLLEYRTKAKGPWASFRLLSALAANVQTFSFTPQRTTRYEFRLRACKLSTCSPYSNTASIRTP